MDSGVEPDLELATAALGALPSAWKPADAGYTRSRAWRAETAGGPVFVKEASDEGSLAMLRREALVYTSVRGSFLPALVGFADSGERAVLAVEFLEEAHRPPPYPRDVLPLFQALEQVAAAEPPAQIEVDRRRLCGSEPAR